MENAENNVEKGNNPAPQLSEQTTGSLNIIAGLMKSSKLVGEMKKDVQEFVKENNIASPVIEEGNKGEPKNEEKNEPAEKSTPAANDKQEGQEGKEGEDNAGAEKGENGKKSLLFGNKAKKKSETSELKFEDINDFKAAAKKFGVEIKEPKDFGKVFSTFEKWREDSQKLVETEKIAEGYKGILENLDPVLLDGVKAYHSGQDWKKVINENVRPFDVTKPVEKQDVKKLVEHYFPGEFEKEDFEADEKPKALVIAEKTAKEKFIAEQNSFNSKRASEFNAQKQKLEARKNSVAGSVTELQKSFPDIEKSVLADVQKTMESGDIMSLFLNSDGSYKPEAAKALMLAKYGEQEFAYMMEAEAGKIESKVTEDIVTRASDKPKPNKGTGDSKKAMSKETQAILGSIKALSAKKSTF